jgi:hypothetical protein
VTDGRDDLRGRVRGGEAVPPDASVVLRGGPDTASLLATHARRLSRAYVLDGAAVFGISVFVALDDIGPASEAGILTGKLRSYPLVYRATAQRLIEAGFVLLPTFTRPHYTVLLPALDMVGRLADALGTPGPNPYALGPEEGR